MSDRTRLGASEHAHLGLAVSLGACLAMGGSDRALMLGVPAIAVLAAFALPTLHRGSTAAIDWFSVFFFTVFATAIWIFYGALQTGAPAWALRNVLKLAPPPELPVMTEL